LLTKEHMSMFVVESIVIQIKGHVQELMRESYLHEEMIMFLLVWFIAQTQYTSYGDFRAFLVGARPCIIYGKR
jgi:hypothetical protein